LETILSDIFSTDYSECSSDQWTYLSNESFESFLSSLSRWSSFCYSLFSYEFYWRDWRSSI